MSRAFPSRRICLVLQSGIGGVVHGLPVVNALKSDDPQRHMTWVVERTPERLL
jgi:ADP-heptose:LPS heptosyltransferase